MVLTSHHTGKDIVWNFFCLGVLGNYTLEAVNWSQNLVIISCCADIDSGLHMEICVHFSRNVVFTLQHKVVSRFVVVVFSSLREIVENIHG